MWQGKALVGSPTTRESLARNQHRDVVARGRARTRGHYRERAHAGLRHYHKRPGTIPTCRRKEAQAMAKRRGGCEGLRHRRHKLDALRVDRKEGRLGPPGVMKES